MFGTSGIRGPVGETISTNLALRLGRALGTEATSVVVGRDVRDSGRMLENALVAGLEECGASVVRVGVESTPTIARSVSWVGADVGVSITGSHNPPEENGFKLWTNTGRAFDRDRYRSVIRRANAGTVDLVDPSEIGSDTHYESVREMHADRLASAFDSFDGCSIVLDLGNGTGRLTADVLSRLGCDVTTLNGQRDGRFPGRQSEPTASACERLGKTVEAIDADLGIAHDADADRMVAVDETGRFVPGDELLALFASHAASAGRKVAISVDTSSLVEDVVTSAGGEIVRTAVGDTHVASAVDEPGVVFGGEPSGTWIWSHETLCPDAHFAACQLVELVQSNGPLSQQLSGFADQYAIERRTVRFADKHDAMDRIQRRLNGQFERVDTTDGIRVETDDGWFLVRASGTEPLVRVTAEAANASTVDALLEQANGLIDTAKASV